MDAAFIVIFVIGLLTILVVSIINLVIVKKLTNYLKEKYPKEFKERGIAQTSYEKSTYTPKNLFRLHTLAFLILFTNRLQLDEYSTKYAKISRILYGIVLVLGIFLIGYIFINAALGNLGS